MGNVSDGSNGSKSSDRVLASIIDGVWRAVMRSNPMLLATLRSDYDFERLGHMVRDCLEKGLTKDEVIEHVAGELCRTAITGTQPSESCHGEASA